MTDIVVFALSEDFLFTYFCIFVNAVGGKEKLLKVKLVSKIKSKNNG